MTEITWKNCADEMPPDDYNKIITKHQDKIFEQMGITLHQVVNKFGSSDLSWTPYTPEKWEELNK